MPIIINENIGYGVIYTRNDIGRQEYGFLGRTFKDFSEAHDDFRLSLRTFPNWATPIAFVRITLKQAVLK